MKNLILFIALIIFLTGCDEKAPYTYKELEEQRASDCIKYDWCVCKHYIDYNLETKIDIQTKRSACINVALKFRRLIDEKSPNFLKAYFEFGAKACEDRFSGNDNEWFCKMLNKDFETVCPKGNQYYECYLLKDLLNNNPIAFWEAYHKVL